jgi:hypothetical protein
MKCKLPLQGVACHSTHIILGLCAVSHYAVYFNKQGNSIICFEVVTFLMCWLGFPAAVRSEVQCGDDIGNGCLLTTSNISQNRSSQMSERFNGWRWLLSLRCVVCYKLTTFQRYNRPGVGGSERFWNVGQFLPDYSAQHPITAIFILVAVKTWNSQV